MPTTPWTPFVRYELRVEMFSANPMLNDKKYRGVLGDWESCTFHAILFVNHQGV